MWRSSVEIEKEIKQAPDTASLSLAAALSLFAGKGHRKEDYKVLPEWDQWIKPSPSGLRLLESLSATGFSPADLKYALFDILYHHELLIDPAGCDLDSIRNQLSVEARTLSLHWPNRYGRELYDKFNDQFKEENRTDHLPADQSTTLLESTQQGVFQLYQLVSGPLGLLNSEESRLLPPTLRVPLWHCSDTGCSALHCVELKLPRTAAYQAKEQLLRLARDTSGPSSEWLLPLYRLHRKLPDRGKPHYDLPLLLAEGLVAAERTALLQAAISSPEGPRIREHIARNSAMPPKTADGAPELVAKRLPPDATLQLLLTLRDDVILTLIDRLVAAFAIHVPPGEVRRSIQVPPSLSNLDRRSELSCRGIRAVPDDAVVSFSALINRSYQESSLTGELQWRLRKYGGVSLQDSLLSMVGDIGPALAIRALVLSSEPITSAVMRALGIASYQDVDEEALVDTVAWKLGFNLPRYTDTYSRLRRRLDAMSDACVKVGEVRTEDDREEIRKAGVNLFVSIEEFLARLVSYMSWLLSSDHFVATRFEYDARKATQIVSNVLGVEIRSGQDIFRWNPNGENTLGTLLVYARACQEWTKQLPVRDRTNLRRGASELPHFAEDPDRSFPFVSREFWADCDPRGLSQLADDYNRVMEHLNAADLSFIRNGIDHKRDEERFPQVGRIQTCVSRLKAALDIADERRLVPKSFWLFKLTRHESGVTEQELRDYRERSVKILGPTIYSGGVTVDFGWPVVLAPNEILGHANQTIVFQVKERSAFSDYWAGYPRRRFIPPVVTAPQAEDAKPRSAEGQSSDGSNEVVQPAL